MNIKKIYNMLNWENTFEVQEEGRRLAKEVKDLSILIMPPAPASVWENCAVILCAKSDEELEPFLKRLLEWLYDTNWPGALTILERLKIFSADKLLKPFLDSYYEAVDLKIKENRLWLIGLIELLENENLKDALPISVLNDLRSHEEKWDFWDNI